jgi:hypothetical protein
MFTNLSGFKSLGPFDSYCIRTFVHKRGRPLASIAGSSVPSVLNLNQLFSTAGPRPGTGLRHQLYRAARSSP